MKITKAVILTRKYGTDKVILHTDLPSPFPPSVSQQSLFIEFDVQQGKGLEYVEKHFSPSSKASLEIDRMFSITTIEAGS